ncbi:hypothetical protein [Bergeyella zoohelcum]|uniref:hypothetical protein n=1 Tax=Bergeyella zoohelcum TaxID=1015 RepID=UPI002A90FCD9|nr:hypothetical protein [Bergeyella zoohelcum]MDY6024916.1 hypothetical protein [Bergeyella zoohelcum]
MKYLKFKSPWENSGNKRKKSFIENIVFYLGLSSNPDYECYIDEVESWMVEFDEENIPIREIGIDDEGKAILKMPYKKNYGYWTDNSLEYEDFTSSFMAVKIRQEEFEEKWEEIK